MKKINLIILFILFLGIGITNAQWTQIGVDVVIDGSDAHINMNSDGDIMVSDYRQAEPNGIGVIIYNLENNVWVIKDTIKPNNTGNIWSLSLSDDGKILAISRSVSSGGFSSQSIIVFENIDNVWGQRGDEILIEDACYYLKISNDGNNIISASDMEDNGEIKVYKYNQTQWEQKGSTIFAESLDGQHLDINYNGDIIAIETRSNGFVTIYEYDTNWTNIGIIDTNTEIYSINFNYFGNIIGICDTNVTFFYEYVDGVWEQMGNSIEFTLGFNSSSMDSTGQRIIAKKEDYSNCNFYVFDYDNETDTWIQNSLICEFVPIETGDEYYCNGCWNTVSISNDGLIISIVSNTCSEDYHYTNVIKTYIVSNSNIENENDEDFTIFPNPTTGFLYVYDNMEKIELYNINGNMIKEFYDCDNINIENISNGHYYVKLIKKNNIIIKKIVKI